MEQKGFREQRGLDAMTMYYAARAWIQSQDKAAAIEVVKQRTGRQDARKALLRSFRKHGWISTSDRRSMGEEDYQKELRRLQAKAGRNPRMRYIGEIESDLIWEAAFRYYYDRHSFRQLASWMQPKTPRENQQSVSESLRRAWHINGWPVREREEALRLRKSQD